MKKKIQKALLSLLLVGLSFFCFYFPTKKITTIVYKNCNEKSITIEDDGTKLFLNYIGLFLLIMSVWIWRKEMRINQIGIIGNNGIEPTDPENLPNDPPPDMPSPLGQDDKISKIDEKTELENFKRQELKNQVINYLKAKQFGITNALILSNTFGVSKQKIELILFELMKEGLIRRETYPGSGRVNYSLSSSLENRAIDDFIRNCTKLEVLSDNRFVRINQRYEVDAIIQTSLTYYVVEVKKMDKVSSKRIDDIINQLLKIEEQLKLSPLKLALVITTNKDIDKSIFDEYQSIENLLIHIYNYNK